MPNSAIRFLLNGRPIELTGRDALLPLTVLLRERLGLTGTKVVCAEGDCGACTVLLGRPRQTPEGATRLDYVPIDACIYFAFQCQGTHVVTIEGLDTKHESKERTLTVIQEALVAGHGSQCGFCTPGIVMALHGQIERDAAAPPLEEASVRCALSGNLCRCTGYQQIFDACSALDGEPVERLAKIYDEQVLARQLETSRHAVRLNIQVPQTKDQAPDDAKQNGVLQHWAEHEALPSHEVILHVPQTLDQALAILDQYPGCLPIAGATDVGVWHNHGTPWPDHLLALNSVDELSACHEHDDDLNLGAGATWDQVIRFVEPFYPEFVEILVRFGSPQIREAGTIGGNIVNGSPIADSLPFLFVVDATIEARSHQRGTRQIPIVDFYTDYKQNLLEQDELLVAIALPKPKKNEKLFLEKTSKRRDMDISTFTAGINLQLSDDMTVIKDAAVAFGGVGPVVKRLAEVEAALIGKPLLDETFIEAGGVARKVISPITDVRGHAEFRKQLAENILLKAYHGFSSSEVLP